jgi:tetratricopeptide (TPR) repeat protein
LTELGPPDERSASLAALASERLAAAGLRSFDRGDMSAAANLLGRAATLLPPRDPKRLRLLSSLAEALIETGRLDEANATLADVLRSGREEGDRGVELRATTSRLHLWLLQSPDASHNEAVTELERVIAGFEELQDDGGLAEALRLLAIVRFWAGRCEEALSVFERAARYAARVGDRRLELDAKHWMNVALAEGPTPAGEAIDRVRDLLRGNEDDRTFLCSAYRAWADMEAIRGNFPEARSLLTKGSDIARELGLTVELAAGFQRTAGYVALLAGDLLSAEDELRAAVATLERIGDTGHLASAAPDLAIVLLESPGRESEALELLVANEARLIEDDVDAQVRSMTAKSRALVRLGEATEA